MERRVVVAAALILQLMLVGAVAAAAAAAAGEVLRLGFYDETCKDVESIVKTAMVAKFKAAPTSAAATLRLFFHDCFVNGCDGSVLLDSTDDNKAERDADVNLSLPGDGFDSVVKAKEAVEKACPGVVSCADLLAIATRDLLGLVGGPFYNVLLGRRDSRVSRAADATEQLPLAEDSMELLSKRFAAKGFSQSELVTLSGAHTIGFVHCDQFLHRIYNNPGTHHPVDLQLDPKLAAFLRDSCPPKTLDPTVVVSFDVETPRTFDNAYYQNLVRGRGVITSDQRLFTDPGTREQVVRYAQSSDSFLKDFVAVMHKLGSLGVLTGSDVGEIRHDCAIVNPHSSPSSSSRQ